MSSYVTEECARCEFCSEQIKHHDVGCNGNCPDCFPSVPDWN